MYDKRGFEADFYYFLLKVKITQTISIENKEDLLFKTVPSKRDQRPFHINISSKQQGTRVKRTELA